MLGIHLKIRDGGGLSRGEIDAADDSILNVGGARVVVDSGSAELLRGSTIDYKVEMILNAFVVSENLQSESACGCGSSFAIKNFR